MAIRRERKWHICKEIWIILSYNQQLTPSKYNIQDRTTKNCTVNSQHLWYQRMTKLCRRYFKNVQRMLISKDYIFLNKQLFLRSFFTSNKFLFFFFIWKYVKQILKKTTTKIQKELWTYSWNSLLDYILWWLGGFHDGDDGFLTPQDLWYLFKAIHIHILIYIFKTLIITLRDDVKRRMYWYVNIRRIIVFCMLHLFLNVWLTLQMMSIKIEFWEIPALSITCFLRPP